MWCIKQTCQPSGWWNLKSTTIRTPYWELLHSSQQCSYFVSFRSPWFLCFMSAASFALVVDGAARSCGYPHLELTLPEEGLFKLCGHRGCDHSESAFHWNPRWCSSGGRRRIQRRLLLQTWRAPEVELGPCGCQLHVLAIRRRHSTATCMTGHHTQVLPSTDAFKWCFVALNNWNIEHRGSKSCGARWWIRASAKWLLFSLACMITIRITAWDWPFQWTAPFSPKYYLCVGI